MSVSAVIWFTNTDDESEKNIRFLKWGGKNKFQYKLSVKNYMTMWHFGAITFTEHI
jgi:hypothetical protein